jgi:hypothetical protein
MWQVVSVIEKPPKSLPFASSGTLDHLPYTTRACCAGARTARIETSAVLTEAQGMRDPPGAADLGWLPGGHQGEVGAGGADHRYAPELDVVATALCLTAEVTGLKPAGAVRVAVQIVDAFLGC